jgi:hypothetical protein
MKFSGFRTENTEGNECELLLSDALPVAIDNILYRKVGYLSTYTAICGSSLHEIVHKHSRTRVLLNVSPRTPPQITITSKTRVPFDRSVMKY